MRDLGPSNGGACAPSRRVAVLGVGAGGGRPLSLRGSEGVTPGIFFEIFDAKSRVWRQFVVTSVYVSLSVCLSVCPLVYPRNDVRTMPRACFCGRDSTVVTQRLCNALRTSVFDNDVTLDSLWNYTTA